MQEVPPQWQDRLWALARPLWACRGICCREQVETEFIFGRGGGWAGNPTVLQRNVAEATAAMSEFLAEARQQCLDEQQHHTRQGTQASSQKRNRWHMYTDKSRVQQVLASVVRFIKSHPECRTTLLPRSYLRALVLLQHGMSEDTADLCRPEEERRHCDAFEGVLTASGINSQLVKDAHRSEWAIEGRAFTLQNNTRDDRDCLDDRKAIIADFQRELVTSLEHFLLDYCGRQELSRRSTQHFMQAVSTQMSQAGLANLEHSSQASRIFVSGEGLEQRTAYNVSTMRTVDRGEIVKLSIFCMKTGFKSYITPDGVPVLPPELEADDDEDLGGGPIYCSTASYLYQYATLGFAQRVAPDGSERLECLVLDLLDEIHILPVEPL